MEGRGKGTLLESNLRKKRARPKRPIGAKREHRAEGLIETVKDHKGGGKYSRIDGEFHWQRDVKNRGNTMTRTTTMRVDGSTRRKKGPLTEKGKRKKSVLCGKDS